MRIVSGILRGRIIQQPKNLRARPTTDFAKENLFTVIESHRDIEGADVLDLFADRLDQLRVCLAGAAVVSVEINAVHYDFIRRTARISVSTGFIPSRPVAFLSEKLSQAVRPGYLPTRPYDIVGSDTIPGDQPGRRLLKPGGWLILEHPKSLDGSGFEHFVERRSYGSVQFSIFVQP